MSSAPQIQGPPPAGEALQLDRLTPEQREGLVQQLKPIILTILLRHFRGLY